jgi:TPR repeat protein
MELSSPIISQRSAVLNSFQTPAENSGNPITDIVMRKMPCWTSFQYYQLKNYCFPKNSPEKKQLKRLYSKLITGPWNKQEQDKAHALVVNGAKNGKLEAQLLLAGIPINIKKAIWVIEKAAINFPERKKLDVGREYYTLFSLTMPDELKKILSLMDDDSAGEQFQLAQYYKKGSCGLAKNEAKAFELFQQAADKGHHEAKYQLALCHRYALGTTEDPVTAFLLILELAKKGDTNALINVGVYYQHGIGVAQNFNEAAKYYQKALKKGNKDALKNMKGIVASHCPDEIKIDVLHSLIENEDPEAMFKLAVYYQKGNSSLAKDEAKAFQLFHQAADNGHLDASCSLALCYYFGSGVAQNEAKAFKLFQYGADQGHLLSICNLARSFELGVGGTVNQKLAFEFTKHVADNGNVQNKSLISWAQARLAGYYTNGIGVPQSYTQSAIYFQKSADNEMVESLFKLALLYEDGKGVPKDEARCIHLLKKSAAKGCSEARAKLIQKGYEV